ncbi:NfeD family protein [Sphingomonas hylomeconis]|uniref:NfeD family protein n=1 Tax=Sphingomonas hylomeconis TaxID=1395958 RepID=A0ABV7SV01_9SPHN|nr:NfeD family protein [Sphingomonas hylomeconis]
MTLGGISAGTLWLALALLLGLAELLIPGVFLIFLAVAAAITGAATLALPDLPLAAQLGSFAIWSGVTVLIGRRWYHDYPVATADPLLNDRAARLVGEIVVVEQAIEADGGRVRVGDGVWPARGPDAPTGARVRVVEVDRGVLVVEPIAALTPS